VTSRRTCGFTLIELLAVVATIALIAAMVVPNLNLGGGRAVRTAASDLASAIEMARERAILTGRMHAVVIDVDRGSHWVEWAAPPEKEPTPAREGREGEPKIDLVPPALESDELVPLPGDFGKPHLVEAGAAILGVEIDGGVADTGEVSLRIDGDGATDAARIRIGDTEGRYVVQIDVEPLADEVAVVREEQ
jgi:prepilin-type N-terminal cleavage/methylation domain-containing protein